MTDQAPPPAPTPPPNDLGDRIQAHAEAFGREAQVRGEQLGREAQAAADRWSKDPGVVRAATTAGRLWGLALIAVGLWFFVEVTLGYSLPALDWNLLWPVILIALGLVVVVRGMTRRA
ncbi:MAG TPA: hypothetical protein VKR30_04170 [Candidatus Limnocylindrales bacterium]|nr:hypothetical protein [Candidatus Limnocylindrales bacterium]